MTTIIGRRALLGSLGALAGGYALRGQTPGRYSAALKKVDELFAAEYAKNGFASITAGVISGSELIWTTSYGYANSESKTAATADNVYRIGSITKQFTDIAFLQLVKRGKVRLTDPVEKYLPEINTVQNRPQGSPPITLLQLATHTSGLDREPADMETYVTGPVATWDKTLITALAHTKYAFEPGTRQVYSNIAVGSLGLALSRAAGEPYIDYLRKNVLEPLGLKNTAFEQTPALLKKLATGYVARDGKPDSTVPTRELHTGRGYKVPNGALFTTVADLSRFVSLELGNGPAAVIDKETLADNYSRVYASDAGLRAGFGLGFELLRKGDLVVAGHGGSVAGFIAGAYFHSKSQTGLIFLRNLSQGIRNDLVLDAFSALTNAA
jgi:CubicO group peptidase (beta-lactamase class C family)